MRRGTRFLWVSILLFLCSVGARAEESLPQAPRLALAPAAVPKAPPLWGGATPVALFSEPPDRSDQEPPRFHFTPSLDLIEVYDDNILLRSVRRESDYITRVQPGLEMAVEQERVKWLTDLKAEFEAYRDHPELSTFDRSQTLDTRLTIRPDPRWTLDFGEAFLHSIDPAEEEMLALLFQRADYFINTLSLKGAYRWTPRLTAEVEGINRSIQFSDPFLVDVESDEVRAALAYLLTPRDTVTPQYDYRNFYFQRRGYTETHSASLKEERRFTETLTGRALIGALLIVDRGIAKSDVLLGAGIDQTASPTVVFHLDYTRDVAVVGGLYGAFMANMLTGSVTAHVTEAFDSMAVATASIEQALLAPHPNVNTWGARIEERYAFVPWLKGFLSYAYMSQRQSGARDIYDNRVLLGLTVSRTYPERP